MVAAHPMRACAQSDALPAGAPSRAALPPPQPTDQVGLANDADWSGEEFVQNADSMVANR